MNIEIVKLGRHQVRVDWLKSVSLEDAVKRSIIPEDVITKLWKEVNGNKKKPKKTKPKKKSED